jgi:hypothetical protein
MHECRTTKQRSVSEAMSASSVRRALNAPVREAGFTLPSTRNSALPISLNIRQRRTLSLDSAKRGYTSASQGSVELADLASPQTTRRSVQAFAKTDTSTSAPENAKNASVSTCVSGTKNTQITRVSTMPKTLKRSKRGIALGARSGVPRIAMSTMPDAVQSMPRTQNRTKLASCGGDAGSLIDGTLSPIVEKRSAVLSSWESLVRTPLQSGRQSLRSSVGAVRHAARSACSRRITSSRSREAAAITLSTSRGFVSRAILASARAWLPDYSIPSSTVCTSSRSFVENKSEESHV